MINIAVFASGNGSNAINIYNYFKNHSKIKFTCIYCNNPKAGIIEKSKGLSINCRVFNKVEWQTDVVTNELISQKIDFIILAGFLWLIPSNLIKNFNNKIINIHPSLLPKYGGKGMYGENVHKSVILNKERESGISIHIVNEKYDDGKIIFQKKITLTQNETSETLATKIHELEYLYFPEIIEKYIIGFNR